MNKHKVFRERYATALYCSSSWWATANRTSEWRIRTMPTDTTWAALADAADATAERAMGDRFQELSKLSPDDLVTELRPMIMEEYALDATRLAKFTSCRLRSLLKLPERDAVAISDGYNQVFNTLPGELAMRRATVVQTAARDMTPEQIEKLHAIIPAFTSQIPAARTSTDRAPGTSPERAKKKPAWMFWSRS
jgi:hypothetical protein